MKQRLHPSLLLVFVPATVTVMSVFVAGWRWQDLAIGMSDKMAHWFLRAAPLPALLFGPLAGLLTVWVLPLHHRRPIALMTLVCFLAVAGLYGMREFDRLGPFVENGSVTCDRALSFLDAFAVLGAIVGFLIVAVAARISVVVPNPVKRAKRATFGDADWLSMSATGRLFPLDGEIVIGERYRVDREIVHELPFDPVDRSTWGQGG